MCGVDHSFQFHLINFSLPVNANIALLIVPNESLFTCKTFFFLVILIEFQLGLLDIFTQNTMVFL